MLFKERLLASCKTYLQSEGHEWVHGDQALLIVSSSRTQNHDKKHIDTNSGNQTDLCTAQQN
jgi:hypothetical protein